MQSGTVIINNAELYYEIAGEGATLVMIHAGIADSRQWNGEFDAFKQQYRVLRYDMRGFGRSEPVEGEYSHMGDLLMLLDSLDVTEPVILMGCSMGGKTAMNFSIEHSDRVQALIMVDSGPVGLELGQPSSEISNAIEEAYEANDLELTSELEMQFWFDGTGRTKAAINTDARRLAFEMNRIALTHEKKELGTRLADLSRPAVELLHQIGIPVLIIVGANDTPYTIAAADYMAENIASAQKAVIENAGHLPNMEHPAVFQQVVSAFLKRIVS